MELLRPEDIVPLRGLAVRARAVADGVFSGRHRSLHRGASRDFSEHKEYTPGDDLRTLDWKAYARFDRPLVRRYESETERGCLILLDVSPSMDYGTGALSKLEWARVTAAALAYVLLAQHDRVGVGLCGATFRLALPARARGDQLAAVVSALEHAAPEPTPPERLGAVLGDALEAAPRRGLVVVLSDLLDPRPEVTGALRRLAAGRRELATFQVLDPAEIDFPFDGHRRFLSDELPGQDVVDDARRLRGAYLRRLAAWHQDLSDAAAEAGFAFLTSTTAAPPAALLLDWIAARTPGRSAGREPDARVRDPAGDHRGPAGRAHASRGGRP